MHHLYQVKTHKSKSDLVVPHKKTLFAIKILIEQANSDKVDNISFLSFDLIFIIYVF